MENKELLYHLDQCQKIILLGHFNLERPVAEGRRLRREFVAKWGIKPEDTLKL